ncbi:Zn-dependent hydrolase, partial [Achromobacter ruhlandii]
MLTALPVFPPLNAERLWSRVETLSRYTLPDQPWTRRAFSPLFLQAREWLRGEFEAAGLATRLDAGGNLIGTRA